MGDSNFGRVGCKIRPEIKTKSKGWGYSSNLVYLIKYAAVLVALV